MAITVADLSLRSKLYLLNAGQVLVLYPGNIGEYQSTYDAKVPEGVKAQVTVRPVRKFGDLSGNFYYYRYSGELNGTILYCGSEKLYLNLEDVQQAQRDFRQKMYEEAQRALTSAAQRVSKSFEDTQKPVFGEEDNESNG